MTTDTISQLKKSVSQFPSDPGVYIMKDFDGTPIYIGKAKNLKNRVKSYFNKNGDGRVQIEYLLRRVATIERVVTGSEEEAFLLERDMILKHKPRYNIRLKDDKSYLSVRVDRNHPWPRLELVRRPFDDGADYYGPFTSSYQLKELLNVIKKVIPLRSCSDTVFHNRQRPCLEYEIKRCAGPCCLPVDNEQYRDWLKEATTLLEGKTSALVKNLEKQMEFAAEDLQFEQAAVIRDRIHVIARYSDRTKELAPRGAALDAFGFYREGDKALLAVLKVRGGRVSDIESFTFKDLLLSDEEIIEETVTQFYSEGREVPHEIILPSEFDHLSMLKAGLKAQTGRAIEVLAPKVGSKHRLFQLAQVNAKHQFSVKFFSESRYEEIAKKIQDMLHLKQTPRRIECVDISNFQGSDIVGAIVAYQDGLSDRRGYRKYKISFQDKPNDFEAIYEVVTRRLKNAEKLPDLLIIDGGRQQLERALQARNEAGVELEIVSLAKMRVEKGISKDEIFHKPERIFVEGAHEPLPLDVSSSVTHFIQRVRDEVHRYVITFHRAMRGKRVFKSVLDDIPGIGAERRQRLLKYFGSVDAIKAATAESVATAGRMPLPLAIRVLKSLGQ